MRNKKYIIIIIGSLLVILVICGIIRTRGNKVIFSNITQDVVGSSLPPESLNISMDYKYNLTLGAAVKDADPHIIQAVRQSIVKHSYDLSLFENCNGMPVNDDIYIFEINETKKNNWLIKYYKKSHDEKDYNKNLAITVKVIKQSSGKYTIIKENRVPFYIDDNQAK